MNKALLYFLLISITIISLCLPAISQDVTGRSSGEPSATSAVSATGGKVVVPPAKLSAISVPKIGAGVVTIDGKISEEIWQRAAVFKDFYQIAPGYNTAPSRPTEVYMMYDEKNLYVAFKCWDEKDKIRASVANRDSVTGEDNVRLWLDTFNDQRRAYILAFNPFGIQQDGIETEGRGADFSVDIVMESKGVIEDWGWAVEVKIPFKSLRYSAGKGKAWGFNVARNIDRFNDELDQWYPDDRDISGRLVKFGKITGLDEIKYEKTLEVVPSITVSQSSERVQAKEFTDGRFVNHGLKTDIGVNLKYTFSPELTLDAAINPDYAEIEADAPVVTANQRFPIFFPEKRPFFLEGKEIFETSLQTFYSRTIVDPDLALKLTGKREKTSYGILAASDNAPGNYSEDERTRNRQCLIDKLTTPLLVCPISSFVDKNATFGVVRVKQDFGSNNNIGFMGTARIFPKNRNFTGGFDGRIKFNNATLMTFQAVGTYSKKNFYDPTENKSRYRAGSGFGYFWNLDYTKESHGWYAEVFGRTQDYQADAGFTRRRNTNQAFFAYRESTKSNEKKLFIRTTGNQFARYTFDWSGRPQYGLLGMGVNTQMQGSLFLNMEGGIQFERLYEEEFGAKRNANGQKGAFYGEPERSHKQPYISFNANKVFNKQLNGYFFTGTIFGQTDYDFGGGGGFARVSPAYQAWLAGGRVGPVPGLDPGRGLQFDLQAGFSYKPVDALSMSFDYTNSHLRRNDTNLLAFDTNIFSLRSRYQFTRFTFVRARWDYDTLSNRVGGQMLFGWNPNPGTAIYAGYNDSLNYRGSNPYTGSFEDGLVRNGRTLFIRASYLFRKSF